MTDSPPPGGPSLEGSDARFTSRPGQHENPEPAPIPATPAGARRHGMAGAAGYPQFAGPGAAQYGTEPLEPAPALIPQPSAAPMPSAPAPAPHNPGVSDTFAPAGPPPGPMPPVPPPGFAPPRDNPPPSYVPPQQNYLPQEPLLPATEYLPAAGGYGAQQAPAGDGGVSVAEALGYGWNRFRANPFSWIAITLVGFVAYLAVAVVVNVGNMTSVPAILLLSLVVSVLIWLLQAAMIRGALYETDGNPPDFQAFFGFTEAGNVLITALIVFAATAIGFLLVLPAIVIAVLCMFSLHFVIDQDEPPFTAIRSSIALVLGNLRTVLVLALCVGLMTVVAMIPCGLGLLVVGPITIMAVTFTYRLLTGSRVV